MNPAQDDLSRQRSAIMHIKLVFWYEKIDDRVFAQFLKLYESTRNLFGKFWMKIQHEKSLLKNGSIDGADFG